MKQFNNEKFTAIQTVINKVTGLPVLTALVLSLTVSFFCTGQEWKIEWSKQLGNSSMDMFSDVVEIPGAGYTVTGATIADEGNHHDFWMVHFNSAGEVKWSAKYGTAGNDFAMSLTRMTNGNYVICGITGDNPGEFHMLMVMTDSLGKRLWQKEGKDPFLNSSVGVIPAENNSFIISGTQNTGNETGRIWLSRFDINGETVWEKFLEESKTACVKTIKGLPDGEFLLSGQIRSRETSDADLWLFRFNGEGVIVWQKQLNSPGVNVWPECICCSPDSNIMVTGWYGSCMNDINSENPVFDYDLLMVKVSPSGNVIWSKNIDSEGSEGGNGVAVLPDGRVLLAGKKETSFMGRIGPWLLLSDKDGKIISEIVLPFLFTHDQAVKIINTSDGGFVVIGPGLTNTDNTRSNGWIKKFSAF